MCIIIAKNKKDRLPSETELQRSFTINSDGAGFMYVENGKVIIDKGYMDYKKFIRHYRVLCKKFNNFENKSLVIHCRIGTSGTNSKMNCHPYPITNDIGCLHKTYYRTSLGVAHNGIIYDYNPTTNEKRLDINDTQNYIRKYLSPLYNSINNFYKNEYIKLGIKSMIGNSKLAILDNKDNLVLIGNFVNDNKLSFSNTTYKEIRYVKTYNDYDYDYDNYIPFWYGDTKTDTKKNTELDTDYSRQYEKDLSGAMKIWGYNYNTKTTSKGNS